MLFSWKVYLPFETPTTASELLQQKDETHYLDIELPIQMHSEMLTDYLYQADLSLDQVLLVHTMLSSAVLNVFHPFPASIEPT